MRKNCLLVDPKPKKSVSFNICNNNESSDYKNYTTLSKVRKTKSCLQTKDTQLFMNGRVNNNNIRCKFLSHQASEGKEREQHQQQKQQQQKQEHSSSNSRCLKQPSSSSRWDTNTSTNNFSTSKKDVAFVSPCAPRRKKSRHLSTQPVSTSGQQQQQASSLSSRWESEQPLTKTCGLRHSFFAAKTTTTSCGGEKAPTCPRRHSEDDTMTLKSAIIYQKQQQHRERLNNSNRRCRPRRYSDITALFQDNDSVPKRPSRLVPEESIKRFESESSSKKKTVSPPRLLRRKASSDSKILCELMSIDCPVDIPTTSSSRSGNSTLDIVNFALEEMESADF